MSVKYKGQEARQNAIRNNVPANPLQGPGIDNAPECSNRQDDVHVRRDGEDSCPCLSGGKSGARCGS